MTKANGWHRHERVHIQGQSGEQVLVQYVARFPIRGMHKKDEDGSNFTIPSMLPWAWLDRDEVTTDADIDDALAQIWSVA